MRKKRGPEEQSMDSLMDTLTNVVGILMFVLMITMLSVNDAVKQIVRAEAGVEKKEVTPEDLEEMRATAEELQQQVQTLAAKEQEIKETLSTVRLDATRLEREVTQGQTAVVEPPPDPKELQAQLEQQQQQVEQLRRQVEATQEKAEQVGQELAAAPELEETPAKVVYLPDPRPAPEGLTQELFLCRGGRVIHVHLDRLQKLAAKRGEKTVKAAKDGKIDCDELLAIFENSDIGDEDFRLKFQVINGHPFGLLVRRPESGDTLEELESPSCDFRRTLRLLNPRKEYCRYLVWPDSFEVYLKARELSDERKMMAGWQPTLYDPEWPVYIVGITHLRCKDAPPPPPAAGAAPQAPPKPMDIID